MTGGLHDLLLLMAGGAVTGTLASVGWIVNRVTRRTDTQAVVQARETTELALLRRDVDELAKVSERSARHRQAISEELGVVSTILERHEAWHARHDPGSTDGGH